MKFNCGLTHAEKIVAQCEWHDVFILWPRRVGPNDCRWLETVEAKREPTYRPFKPDEVWVYMTEYINRWEYRAKDNGKHQDEKAQGGQLLRRPKRRKNN